MIESLSNPEWINPQIDFLLFLQNIRLNCSDIIDKFFLSITIFGEFWLPTLICAIVYWCIDFKAGIYLFSLEGFNKIFAFFLILKTNFSISKVILKLNLLTVRPRVRQVDLADKL